MNSVAGRTRGSRARRRRDGDEEHRETEPIPLTPDSEQESGSSTSIEEVAPPVMIDLASMLDHSCIDLTAESDYIDLTSPIENSPMSPVIIHPRESNSFPSTHAYRPLALFPEIVSDSDDDLPQMLPTVTRKFDSPIKISQPVPEPSKPAEQSPSCPICLETLSQIRSTGRVIMSTTCGHVFCKSCLTDAMKTEKKCPVCRKKLTQKNIHPVFL